METLHSQRVGRGGVGRLGFTGGSTAESFGCSWVSRQCLLSLRNSRVWVAGESCQPRSWFCTLPPPKPSWTLPTTAFLSYRQMRSHRKRHIHTHAYGYVMIMQLYLDIFNILGLERSDASGPGALSETQYGPLGVGGGGSGGWAAGRGRECWVRMGGGRGGGPPWRVVSPLVYSKKLGCIIEGWSGNRSEARSKTGSGPTWVAGLGWGWSGRDARLGGEVPFQYLSPSLPLSLYIYTDTRQGLPIALERSPGCVEPAERVEAP